MENYKKQVTEFKKGDLVRKKSDGRIGKVLDDGVLCIAWIDGGCNIDWKCFESNEPRIINNDNFELIEKIFEFPESSNDNQVSKIIKDNNIFKYTVAFMDGLIKGLLLIYLIKYLF